MQLRLLAKLGLHILKNYRQCLKPYTFLDSHLSPAPPFPRPSHPTLPLCCWRKLCMHMLGHIR